MYGAIRTHLGKILHELAKQKESLDSGGPLDVGPRPHVHQHPTEVCGFERGGVHQRQECDLGGTELPRTQTQLHWRSFWALGYFVSTVGLDEEMVRKYIVTKRRRTNVWTS